VRKNKEKAAPMTLIYLRFNKFKKNARQAGSAHWAIII
jgi:hypothetical protein